MRSTLILALTLACAAPLAADTNTAVAASPSAAAQASPAPTLVPTFISNPPVAQDPSFTDVSYAAKWPHITLDEAKRLQANKHVVFVDGRSQLEWDQSHIPGSIALPLGDFEKDFPLEEKALRKAKILVAYCHGKGCHLSDGLAQQLVDKGFKNVAVFWGGFPEWHDSGQLLVDKNGKPVAAPTPVPTAAPAASPVTTPAPAAK
ncbi:MAG TPA: rhodanese-like domain-containing protein [bacterium]|jgi:rhodanese-related sulfurtransferase|nr:rhodanese-like domain-containing protein [bacterium]